MSTPPAAGRCQFCGGPLRASPSPDFCCPEHQAAWHQRRAEPAPAVPGWAEGRWPTSAGERDFRPAWAPPPHPHWRLPRRTGDHLRDTAAARRARATADTPARRAAAALQLDLIQTAARGG